MLKRFKAAKNKKTIFICQITESALKIVKCLAGNGTKRQFAGFELEAITRDTDDTVIAEKLNGLFKKLGYSDSPVIIALAHNYVTSRCLKVPTQAPREIEQIASLQASRYLPYPANELITGYQIILRDKDNYSHINLIIVHKDIIERYLKIFHKINIKNLNIVLGAYGLCSLYSYIEPQDLETAMLIDINLPLVEVAIAAQGRLLFSRSFRLLAQEPNRRAVFNEEIRKTKDACSKEIQGLNKEAAKIILTGQADTLQEFKEAAEKELNLPVKVLDYPALHAEQSLAALVGLGVKDTPESLSLLPQRAKEEKRKISAAKERLRFVLYIAGLIFIIGLAVAKTLDNKRLYLARIKAELSKISKEARPLEEIERRFRILEEQAARRISGLDIIYEVHKIIPAQVSLNNFSYDEEGLISLRGASPELNYIITFVSQLKNSPVFKNFDVKIRYATQKVTKAGELIDFEIICSKPK